jgi:YbbR domain-containing protein
MIKFLRHLVLDDFLLKLFSLALALLFWLTISFAIQQKEAAPTSALPLNSEVRTFFNLPVLVVSSAADVRQFKVSPSQVRVTVRGEPRILENVHTTDIRATVDLTGIETARNLRKRIEVSTPAGVTYVRVSPEDVQVIIPTEPRVK